MRRVRFISFTDASFSACLDLSLLFDILRNSLPTQHFFPNATGLSWILKKSSAFPHINLFLAPRITDINLGTLKCVSQFTLVPALAVRCPLLTHVRLLQAELHEADQSQPISLFVRGLTHLQSLELDYLDHEAFEHLARLPGLRTLKLGTPRFFYISSSDSDCEPEQPSFVALETLELSAAQSQCILPFIHALSQAPLSSFVLQIKQALPIISIYAALERNLPPSLLTELSITSDSISAQNWVENHVIGINALRHLFHFHNLTCIILRPPAGLDLDDDAVRRLARAWPQVEVLSLRSRPSPYSLRATLRCLYFLSQYCPDLNTLDMSIDASAVPEMDELNIPVRQYSLIEWEVADSLITSTLVVARFLSGIFGSLDEIRTITEPRRRDRCGA